MSRAAFEARQFFLIMSYYTEPERQTKEDYKKLCLQLSMERDGIALGNICHKLRCRYGMKFNSLQKLSGLPPEEFDELVRQWDDADDDCRIHRKDLSY